MNEHNLGFARALWRIFSLRLTLPLCADKEGALNKLDRYRLALEAFHSRKIP